LPIGLYAVALLLAWPAVLGAQDAPPPPHIAFVEGGASLDREGQTQPATAGVPFLIGDRLRTAAGRVEVLFPDGSALEVDQYSTIEVLSPTLLRATGGRVMLIVAGAEDPASAVRYQIDTPVASASTDGPGEYRVALLSGPTGLEAELAVLRGFGSLSTERGSTPVRAGERSLARDLEAPSFPQIFNSARFDAFDRWAALRRDARMGTAQSAQYLPRELQMYGGTFDRYGAWQHEPQYGFVWYPAAPLAWRPYFNGYWSSSGVYGWTWIGHDPWGWPTHHYGRWGFSHSRWFWIPERRWAPAWVTWAAAPGYVSWCPLGFDNRPVFALSVHIGNPWRGWVVLPRRHFGAQGAYVQRLAVPHLPADAPVALHAAAPLPPRAVPRAGGAAPRAEAALSRGSGRDVAVPRGGGYTAYDRPSRAGDARAAGVPAAARREAGARASQSPSTLRGEPTASATWSGAGPDRAVGRSPAAAIKQPLAEAPRAFQRRNAGAVGQDSTRPASPAPARSGPRAAERSPSPSPSSWYGQTTPLSGGGRRAARPQSMGDAAAEGVRRAYPRRPAGAPMTATVPGQSPTRQGYQPAPRWTTPPAGGSTGVQRARPVYAPPVGSSPSAPSASPPSPSPGSLGAVSRGYSQARSAARPAPAPAPRAVAPAYSSPAARPSPGAHPSPAARAPAAVPRGYSPRAAPGGAPASAPAREAAPRHAPSSRRPS
jgi:hypothetical protein